jgi:ABC-2 type transport system ATP-binding protein
MNKGKVIIERSLNELQGSVNKLQVACEGEVPALPEGFKVLHASNIGRVHTLIVRGNPEEAVAYIVKEAEKAIVDVLPLSLEEIFIYEMGGVDYEVKDFLL